MCVGLSDLFKIYNVVSLLMVIASAWLDYFPNRLSDVKLRYMYMYMYIVLFADSPI